jgi:predicted ABC-type ATPase
MLVVIRGDSGSGKSTVSRALRYRFAKGECAVVAQDNIRRIILREPDAADGFNITLIEMIARECLSRGRVPIVEGILDADHYAEMLERLASAATGGAFFYAFDLSFEQDSCPPLHPARVLRVHPGRYARLVSRAPATAIYR